MGERSREQESSLRGYEHEFLRAAEALSKGAEGVFVSNAQKIKLYALYKQGTLGDCNKPQPGEKQLLLLPQSAVYHHRVSCLVMLLYRRFPACGNSVIVYSDDVLFGC